MKKNRYVSLLSDTAVFAAGNLLVKLVQFFLVPLYTSAMTTAEYGVGELANNLTEMLCPVVTLSVYMALFRFVLDAGSDRRRLFSGSAALTAGGLCATVLLGGIVSAVTPYAYAWQMALVLASSACYVTLSYFARGVAGAKVYAAGAVLNTLTLCASNILLLVTLRRGASGYLLSIAFGNLAASVFLAAAVRVWRYFSAAAVDRQTVRELLRFSLPMMFTTLAWWLISMPGRYILLYARGEDAAGLLAAASKLPAAVTVLAATFQQAWQISSSRERGSADVREFYSAVFRHFSALVLLLGSLVICLTPLLTSLLLRGDFAPAGRYLPLLMLSAVLHCYSTYYGVIYVAYKNTKTVMTSTLWGAAANVALCALLIPRVGVWGNLLAGVVSYLVIDGIRAADVRRMAGLDYAARMTGPGLALLAAQTVVCSLTDGFSPWEALCFAGVAALTLCTERRELGKLAKLAARKLRGHDKTKT